MNLITTSRKRPGRFASWSTRDILVAAVIPIVFGLILLPILYATHALMAVMGPFGNALNTGLWVIAGIMVPYIIRRPGAAFLGCLLVGLIQGFFHPLAGSSSSFKR